MSGGRKIHEPSFGRKQTYKVYLNTYTNIYIFVSIFGGLILKSNSFDKKGKRCENHRKINTTDSKKIVIIFHQVFDIGTNRKI